MLSDGLAKLKQRVGPKDYIDQPSDMAPYTISMRNRHSHGSPLVLFPRSTEIVADLLKICSEYRIAVIPQGGNSGLVDGSTPSAEGNEVIISLSRMNKIRELDRVASIVTVEAGLILKTLQEAAASEGFLFPLSMGSEGTMQIGGAISTNAGGTAVLRYGNTRSLVLGIEAVLADGSVISSLKKLYKDNTGYNLSQLFIGAEGTLGIVTAATMRLFPLPQQTVTAVLAFSTIRDVMAFFAHCRHDAAEQLVTFEIMARAAIELVTHHNADARFPGRTDAPWYVLLEFASSSVTIPIQEQMEALLLPALEASTMVDAVLAKNASEAKAFWYLRETIPEGLRQKDGRMHFDISLPLDALADFVEQTPGKIAAVAGDIQLLPFGHIGDGNLHYNMFATAKRSLSDFALLKTQIQAIVFGAVLERQGSISAEHGVGLERKSLLAASKAPEALAVMRKLKKALDPLNIMNPGKIFDMPEA